MTFEDWWAKLPTAEQKLIGINNARFVWEEAQKNSINMLRLPTFVGCESGKDIIITSNSGEGGVFGRLAFDVAVGKFFADNF